MTTAASTATSQRIATVAVGVGALVLRLPALSRPRVLVFDELFYAPDAADLLRWGSEHGQPAHPPLAKWFIAAGIRAFGFTPLGWRSASVVAGALLAALVCWTAMRLTGRVDAGVAAGALVAFDGLVHVTSRLALLDIFVALAVAATLAALVAALVAQPDRARAARCWWWAAAALAAGTAVKWSVLALGPLVLAVGWVLAHRLVPPGRPRRRAVAARVVGLVLLPIAALAISAAPRQLGPDATTPGAYAREQADVARYHRDLRPTNRNAAPAWQWALQTHPASLYRSTGPDQVTRIIAGANPVVWLVGLVGLVGAVVGALRGRDLSALLAGAVAVVWLPWVLSPRASYSFYAVALIPPLVLCWVSLADGAPRRWRAVALWAPVGLGALAFVALWPIWSAQPIDPDVARVLTSWPGWS